MSKPKIKPLPPEVEALIKTYQTAQADLVNIIATAEAKGNVTAYRRKILTQVNAELSALNTYAEAWATGYLTKAYTASASALWSELDKMGVDVSQAVINKKALRTVIENATGMLTDANNHVGRVVNDMLRKSALEATAQKLSTGATVTEMKANLISNLTDNGITAIKYANGKAVSLDSYAAMVARTTTTEAVNRSVMQQMRDLDQDLVQMSNHYSSCPICAAYEGRVYSVSGDDKRYPPLDTAFSGDYANIHPNCAHRITPYVEKYDDNAADTREYSNRSFDVDSQSQAEKDAYEAGQAAKAAKRERANAKVNAKLAKEVVD